jgi:cytochrome c5
MAMPAKGGMSSLTQEQAEAIVNYMRQAFAGN